MDEFVGKRWGMRVDLVTLEVHARNCRFLILWFGVKMQNDKMLNNEMSNDEMSTGKIKVRPNIN